MEPKKKAKGGPARGKPKTAGRAKPPSSREGGKRKPSSRLQAAKKKTSRRRRDASPDPERKKGSARGKEDSGRSKSVSGSRGKSGGGKERPVGLLKPEGLPLAVKFVLIISGMIFVIMVISSMVIFALTSEKLSGEIESTGAHMVSSVHGIAKAYLDNRAELEDKYRQHIEAENQERIDEYHDFVNLCRDRFKLYLHNIITLGIEGFRASKVVNALVSLKGDGYSLSPGSKNVVSGKVKIGKYRTVRGQSTDINIYEGRLTDDEGRGVQVLLFTKPVDYRGQSGSVQVALSMYQVEKAKSELSTNIILATIISILVGIGVSFLLASLISRPVLKLVEDISIVSKGRLDHQTLAHSKDEIGVLARTFDAMTQSLKVAEELKIQTQARQHDMKIATEIQAGLLPSKIPQFEGYDIDAFYQPSKEVGGDYYDFIQIDEENIAMTVADVSGKGIPGSMVMTMARSLIRMEGLRNLSAADTLKKVNKVIARDIRRGMFVTALYMILNIKKRTLLVASAGHNPMIIWRQKTGKVDLINPNGIALGFDRGPIFDRTIKEEEIQLAKGDRAVIYTDGVPESMSPANEEFGDDRFYELVGKMANTKSNKFINIIISAVRKHQGDGEQHDDITISTLRVV